ncbi:pimeloyl-ACP methyl ester esterase BioH [Neptunomonas japonica]|uniref:Pimelyl-[acyl-carrier protein] methyl ester esterase n=1 Tax=Neptunomonas japonica JAMM 1380 TaxID=1441457 RepID=A0A7R6SUS6_9GAMM|nr:pimeloyl-ACP methyl ester esterase BioH [Neptunomonas japonica]BBB28814.1 pimelyl-[acyl-carrier protein] methyl ester esterase [Neptunomonas japonica JAMM 1380]
MGLYHKSFGSKANPALILLHGWGMSSSIWSTLLPMLTPYFYVTVVDLPGLGRSSSADAFMTLEAMASSIVSELESSSAEPLAQPTYWLGWSLGGMVALQIASQYPEKVHALMTVASNPCFVQKEDWEHGMNPVMYRQFKAAIESSPEKTLSRFAMLQIQGGDAAKPILKQIKAVLAASQPTQLLATLALLENDLREPLSKLNCPVLHMYGSEDHLVPNSTITAIQALATAQQQTVSFQGAGHLPFLSSPEAFLQAILVFIESIKKYG